MTQNHWKLLSTSQKSKIVWDSKKWIKNSFNYKVPFKNAKLYRNLIPKGFTGTGVGLGVLSSGMIVYDVIDTKNIKASHLLEGAVTGVSFIPPWGWVVGGVYFGADLVTELVSDKSIGEHLDEWIDDQEGRANDGVLVEWR
ncbi:hypothetical protein NLM59_04425 [Weeksellaceae bacterium KMM 9724]|uniref:hypothetical protein n=1 Tax=Profundicola chukchiensis TaxID=2961959 RepID=UPI002440C15C|nr:hypothetical protein [Profundicola chukchiensis]MDG4950159.1 hypothetical protein [Profundicola chukchiensis]